MHSHTTIEDAERRAALMDADGALGVSLAADDEDQIRQARDRLDVAMSQAPERVMRTWSEERRAAFDLPVVEEPTGHDRVTSSIVPGGMRIDVPEGVDTEALDEVWSDSGGMDAFLDALAHPRDPGHDEAVLSDRLRGTARLMAAANNRMQWNALVGRDRWGWTWRDLGDMVNQHHSTVAHSVKLYRRIWAEQGIWVDAAGIATPTTHPTPGLAPHERALAARALAHYRESTYREATRGLPVRVRFHPPAELAPTGTTRAHVSWTGPQGMAGQIIDVCRAVIMDGGPCHGMRLHVGVWETGRLLSTDERYAPISPDATVWAYQGPARQKRKR